jgi:hypothetical protein
VENDRGIIMDRLFSFARVYFLLLTCGSILGLQQAFFSGITARFSRGKKKNKTREFARI